MRALEQNPGSTPAPTSAGPPIRERLRRALDILAAQAALASATDGKGAADLLEREVWDHAEELAGPHPTAIERTLAETAAISWLHLRLAEYRAGRATSPTIPQALYHQRRIDHAHRRYLATLRTLAAVRKLALPSLQINVGANQVNVSQ